MSRIHDALTRGRRAAPEAAPPRSPGVDSVLETLGYGPARRSLPALRIAVWIMGLAVLAIAAYVAWLQFPVPAPTTAVATDTTRAPGRPAAPLQSRAADPVTPPAPQSNAAAQRTTPHRPAPESATAAARASRVSAKAPSPVRDDFQLAVYYQRSGEFDRALVHYKAVLERDELNVEAHNNLALLYKDKGLADDAIREFRRALSINPRYVRARVNLGATLLQKDRPDEAAAEFRTALAIEPRDVDAIVNLALAQKAAGQEQDARGTLIRALAIDPHNAAAHYNLAVEYEQAGEAARAVDHYRAFLETAGPDYAPRARAVRERIATLSARLK